MQNNLRQLGKLEEEWIYRVMEEPMGELVIDNQAKYIKWNHVTPIPVTKYNSIVSQGWDTFVARYGY